MAKTQISELLDYYVEAIALQKENEFMKTISVDVLVNQLIELDKIGLIDENLVDINNAIVNFRDNELRKLFDKL